MAFGLEVDYWSETNAKFFGDFQTFGDDSSLQFADESCGLFVYLGHMMHKSGSWEPDFHCCIKTAQSRMIELDGETFGVVLVESALQTLIFILYNHSPWTCHRVYLNANLKYAEGNCCKSFNSEMMNDVSFYSSVYVCDKFQLSKE